MGEQLRNITLEQAHMILDERLRTHFPTFLKKVFATLNPDTELKWNWHLDVMCEHLGAVERGEIKNLIINVPPRSLKSITVTVAWSAWLLGRNPSESIIAASFSSDLSKKHSVEARLIIESEWFQRVFPETRISDDQNEKDKYIMTKRGQRVATSVGGSITGDGGNCFVAGTLISTENGLIPIDKLGDGGNVLAYCHDTEQYVYRKIRAWREKKSSDIVEIRTANGHKVRCTADHRIYITGQGYREAHSLKAGDKLRTSMQSLWNQVPETTLRNTQDAETQYCGRRVLLEKMLHRASRGKKYYSKMFDMFWSGKKETEILRADVRDKSMAGETHTQPVFVLRSDFLLWQRNARKILFNAVQKCWPLSQYVGAREFSLQGWRVVQCSVLQNASFSIEARPSKLCDLFKREKTSYPSHQRKLERQQGRELNNSLRHLSHDPSQIENDSVSSVERVGCGSIRVYDLEVEGTNNFFANEILVHNCLILDDPLKPDEATSPAVRKSTNAWVRQTYLTRFNDRNTGKFVLVMQRLHEDDVTGNLLEDGDYTHLKLPAEFHEAVTISVGDKSWNIEAGSLLDENRLGFEVLEERKRTLGEVGYAGQYLQDPSPSDGGIVKREWFQLVDDKPNGFDAIVHSWDTAFKKSAGSDYSVCGVWGIRHDGYYLLEIFKRKMEYPELKQQVVRLYERDLPRYILVEDKASGQSILQDLGNMRGVPVLGIIPEMDKVWRMSSCTDVIETKKVKLLAGEPWVENYLDEMCIFPNGRHDDQVDQTSQFLRWAKVNFDRLVENGNVFQEGIDHYDDSPVYTGRSAISGY